MKKHIRTYLSFVGLTFLDTLIILIAVLIPISSDFGGDMSTHYHPILLSLLIALAVLYIREILNHLFLPTRRLKSATFNRFLNRIHTPITKLIAAKMGALLSFLCVISLLPVYILIYDSFELYLSTVIILFVTPTIYAIIELLWFFSLSIFNRKRRSKSELFCVPNKSDFLILGGPGAGKGSRYNENGQEAIWISFRRIDTDILKAELLVDEDTEPILYNGYKIFCICDKIFWYAILINGVGYCFDIRDLVKKIRFPDPQDEMHSIIGNKRNWLQEFFKRLEDSPYFFDIENNFK